MQDIFEIILTCNTHFYWFLFSSHRPLSVENVYNAVQTRIVLKHEQVDADIPEYEEVFRDDEVCAN